MKGAGIFHGDLIVVDHAAEPVTGKIVVAALNGEHTVKRIRREADGVSLEPANPKYQAIWVGPETELHIFGVVVHAIHTLR